MTISCQGDNGGFGIESVHLRFTLLGGPEASNLAARRALLPHIP